MNLGMEISTAQKQQLSQTQIQSLEILSMDNIEVQALLQNEYLENPLFDYVGSGRGQTDIEKISGMYEKMPTAMGRGEEFEEEDTTRKKEVVGEKENEISDYLISQLRAENYSSYEWEIFHFLIECLDDKGFFTLDLINLANQTHYPYKIMARCIEELGQLEPYGVFAIDSKHCLLKQIEMMGMEETPLWEIVNNHMEDVAVGKVSNISRRLKLSTIQVRKYIEQICKLNPKPLNGFKCGQVAFIIPDILITKENGLLEVDLNDTWVQDYKINDYYYQMMKKTKDGDMYEYFKSKLEHIYFLMNSIEQRRKTILRISSAIVERQKEFLEGKNILKPMTMSEVADELNIHASTVSRAIRGKYVQYPGGSIFMKNLFSGAASRESMISEGATPACIKQKIKEIIEQESRKSPYSDLDLVTKLEEQELRISRRTVTKYRQELGIKGSFDRRGFD